jgi:DNA polymerase III delta prime subunit
MEIMDNLGLPSRIKNLLNTLLSNNENRSHLLLIGPPGSGKTTSAKFFVEAIHGGLGVKNNFFGRALFLNSSDERGLDTVRNRVYPFYRSSFKALFSNSNAPKIIVFDEAETLTDQAQLALRPLLDESTTKVLIIFLCNSISRIHPSIIHKFLIIPFEAPQINDFKNRMKMILNNNTEISGIDIEFRRGDIRYFMLNTLKYRECANLWSTLLTTHISKLKSVFESVLQKWTYPDLAMFCIFSAKSLNLLTYESSTHILNITDTDFIKMISFKQRANILSSWYINFVRKKLEAW